MKQKLLFSFLTLTIIWSFIVILLTKNIYIKFNEYEFVSFLLDNKRLENFNLLLEKDIENKEKNTQIQIILWKDFTFSDSLENLWIKVKPIDSEKFKLILSNTYEFLKNFYFSKSGYFIQLNYKLIIDKEKINKRIKDKILSLKKEDFKKYFIKNYTLHPIYWLVGLEDSFPNISLNNKKNKYTLEINTDNLKEEIIISPFDFNKLKIEIPTINNSDLFEEKYQSQIQNYNTTIDTIIWDLNYNYLFKKETPFFSFHLNKKTLSHYLVISWKEQWFFQFKSDFFDFFRSTIISYINNDLHFLEYYISTLKAPDKINWKFKIILKKTLFLDIDDLINKLKSQFIDDNIFINQKKFFSISTKVEDKYYTYKKDYTLIANNPETDSLICETFNWLMAQDDIRKRLEYNIIQSQNIKDIWQLTTYLSKNKWKLNESLTIITQILLNNWLFIQNLNNPNWQIDSLSSNNSQKYNWLPYEIKNFYIDYLTKNNRLIVNSETDFIWYCNFNKDTNELNFSLLSNKKPSPKIIFWPEKHKWYEKWTIEIDWKIATFIFSK